MQDIVDRENKCTGKILELSITKEGKPWSEFYSFVKRSNVNRDYNAAIEDCKGGLVTDAVDKANNLNNYYASVFSCKRNIPGKNSTQSDKTFTIKIIRKRLATIRRNKSGGPDAIPGAILKMSGEAMIL